MFLLGGTSINTCTHGFLEWQWIISQYQVSTEIVIRVFKSTNTHISATSVNVECVFSMGCILLSHLCSRPSVQPTQALMMVGAWSKLGYVKNNDVKAATILPEVEGEEELDENCDFI